jgi:hypothetical protein
MYRVVGEITERSARQLAFCLEHLCAGGLHPHIVNQASDTQVDDLVATEPHFNSDCHCNCCNVDGVTDPRESGWHRGNCRQRTGGAGKDRSCFQSRNLENDERTSTGFENSLAARQVDGDRSHFEQRAGGLVSYTSDLQELVVTGQKCVHDGRIEMFPSLVKNDLASTFRIDGVLVNPF